MFKKYLISFPLVKRPGRGVDHPYHLAPSLKKEYSYTSTPTPQIWAFLAFSRANLNCKKIGPGMRRRVSLIISASSSQFILVIEVVPSSEPLVLVYKSERCHTSYDRYRYAPRHAKGDTSGDSPHRQHTDCKPDKNFTPQNTRTNKSKHII